MKRAILFLAASMLIGNTVSAQANGAWKKTVYRTIEMMQKEDTAKHHLTDVTNDTTLIEIMVSAIKAGKLTAYNTYDHNFTTKMTILQLTEMTGGKADTMEVVDPSTNKARKVVVHHDFDPGAIHKYRLLEEWTFDPNTGKTNIQIQGIAPLREIYGDDGVFRGVQGMFWLRYSDAHDVLARYDRSHPSKTFTSLIWEDYFYSDVKPKQAK